MPNRTTAGFFVPFNQKFRQDTSNLASARQKSASFGATSREAWQRSHASKTNAPEVGKYKPKFG